MRQGLATVVAVLSCFAAAPSPRAQNLQSAAPLAYDAPVDHGPRAKPALPRLGAAGSTIVDPAFGSTITRVTDGRTRPGLADRSYRTPSGTHQNAWSADGRYFYVVSTDGTIVPFAFDRETGRASRVDAAPDGDGGLTLRFYIEPTFSYVTPGVILGSSSGAGASLRTIDQFDFASRTYTRLVDLDTLAPSLSGTYVGGITASAGTAERIAAFFGGASQDQHRYLVIFDRANPSTRRLLDTKASTIDGRATAAKLNFTLHAAVIDRSGRYVTLYPSAADRSAPRNAAPNYVWDTATDTITELPSATALSNGHDAFGYGVRVNQDCCSSTTWDAAQWQLRALSAPLVTRDVITPVLDPKEIYLADHPSWHNASPDRFVPYITGLYRYGANTTAWRAWDDEIVAVQTGLPGNDGARVWRLAHHRSDVRDDTDPGRISFWYTPRPNVSPDGQWVLFTSNWEKTLGTDPAGDSGGRARQDVFLLALKAIQDDGGAAAGPEITTTALPNARRSRSYGVTLTAANVTAAARWSLASGSLPPGLSLTAAGRLAGTPRSTGRWAFSVGISDDNGSATRPLTLQVTR
jgi:hypothetical protein